MYNAYLTFAAIIGLIALVIFIIVYETYKQLAKPSQIKHYKIEESINKLDNRLSSLETTTDTMLKDIDKIKKKINLKD